MRDDNSLKPISGEITVASRHTENSLTKELLVGEMRTLVTEDKMAVVEAFHAIRIVANDAAPAKLEQIAEGNLGAPSIVTDAQIKRPLTNQDKTATALMGASMLATVLAEQFDNLKKIGTRNNAAMAILRDGFDDLAAGTRNIAKVLPRTK